MAQREELDARSEAPQAVKGNAAWLAVVALVPLVKGGTGPMVGRSISVDWLSTLFPLVTFLAKYRHFHNWSPPFHQKSFVNLMSLKTISKLSWGTVVTRKSGACWRCTGKTQACCCNISLSQSWLYRVPKLNVLPQPNALHRFRQRAAYDLSSQFYQENSLNSFVSIAKQLICSHQQSKSILSTRQKSFGFFFFQMKDKQFCLEHHLFQA